MEAIELMNYRTGCKLIFHTYGVTSQRYQLIQELSQLIVAIAKNDLENIIEEMADVEVLFDQFKLADNDITYKTIDDIKFKKVTRQLYRIHNEQCSERNKQC